MKDQEVEHLRNLEKLMPERRARPTVLLPFCDIAGFALGETRRGCWVEVVLSHRFGRRWHCAARREGCHGVHGRRGRGRAACPAFALTQWFCR